MPEYLPLTAHRQVDETCQYPTIFYRAGRFTVEESGEFWLSETPEVHRSRSWDSAFPRMVTYGLFREAGRTESFYFINTHLDNISPEARLQGARMIREFCPLEPAPDPGGRFQRIAGVGGLSGIDRGGPAFSRYLAGLAP